MHCLRAGAPDATLVGIDVGLGKVQRRDILRAELICSDSRQMGGWERPIHFLFVDGNHRYDVVRSDIATFGRHVVVGGLLAFHDYARSIEYLAERGRRRPHRPELGVQRAVDELCTASEGWKALGIWDSIKLFERGEQ